MIQSEGLSASLIDKGPQEELKENEEIEDVITRIWDRYTR
jgi:hypothetical protein